MAEKKKKKGDYLAKPIQELAYNLGLTDNPDPDSVRKKAYGSVAPSRKPAVPPKKAAPKASPDDGAKAAAKTAFNTASSGPSVATKRNYPLPKKAAAKPNPDAAAKSAASTAFNTDSTSGRGRGVSGVAVGKKAPSLSPLGRNAFDIGRAATGRGRGVSSPVSTTPAPKPKAKPSVAPPKPTARPPFSKGSSSPPAYAIPKAKPQLGKKVSSGFSGNWQGAAPSEMQKRGGAKINRGGGLLGKLRKMVG